MSRRSKTDRVRDTLAWWLASQAMKIATPWYRKMVAGSIYYGLVHAAEDVLKEAK